MTEHWLFYLLWVIPGSALGGISRYGLSSWIAVRFGGHFPLGTLVVNVTGAFAIGVLAFLPWEEMVPEVLALTLRLFLIYGFLGGYTTVSSFSLQTFDLIQGGEWKKAGLNVVLSLGACLAAVAAGAGIALMFTHTSGA